MKRDNRQCGETAAVIKEEVALMGWAAHDVCYRPLPNSMMWIVFRTMEASSVKEKWRM